MRNKRRIPIVLERFKSKPGILLKFLNITNVNIVYNIYDDWKLIKKEWCEYSDQRFGQLLSNLGIVDKEIENKIWNIEEDDWLVENGYCNIEDIKFWGVNFYKNGKQRKTIKFVLLKDLKTDHIENIIKFFEGRLHNIPADYLEYFNKRINDGR